MGSGRAFSCHADIETRIGRSMQFTADVIVRQTNVTDVHACALLSVVRWADRLQVRRRTGTCSHYVIFFQL
jgi:hypothetical protein